MPSFFSSFHALILSETVPHEWLSLRLVWSPFTLLPIPQCSAVCAGAQFLCYDLNTSRVLSSWLALPFVYAIACLSRFCCDFSPSQRFVVAEDREYCELAEVSLHLLWRFGVALYCGNYVMHVLTLAFPF